jgi:membrane dipeptidase
MTFSRRDFLKLSLLALSVGACQQSGLTSTLTPTAIAARKTPTPSAFEPEIASGTPPNTETPTPPDPTQTPLDTPTPQPLPSSPAIIIDAHQDIAWNALEFGRNPLESVFESRVREAGTAVNNIMGQRTSGFPEWLAGRIGIIFATLFVMPSQRAYGGFNAMTYNTPQQAEERAKDQLAFYRQLADAEPQLRLIESQADLVIVIDSWSRPNMTPMVGMVILMEGADPIISPADVLDWFKEGLRIIGTSWGATRYAGGTGAPGPLTPLGLELLSAMAEVNMVLDLSHMSRQAYLQAIAEYPGTVIASHSNPHPFLPTDRGLDDTMLNLLADRDGVVGIMPYNRYLIPGWVRGNPRDLVSLDTVAQAVDYVVQLTGSSQHVGIGSDFDGGFGLESIPEGMDSIADLVMLAETLDRWGYSQSDIDAVMYGNWLRILKNTLPV